MNARGSKVLEVEHTVQTLQREIRPRSENDAQNACNWYCREYLDARESGVLAFAISVAFKGAEFSSLDLGDTQYFTPALLVLRKPSEMMVLPTRVLLPSVFILHSVYYHLESRFDTSGQPTSPL
jgi:hypothetical protein